MGPAFTIGRALIALGLVCLVAGVLVLLLARLNLPIGRLPGDLSWRGRGWSVSVPLASSLLLSIVLSLLFWIFGRLR